jgi:hypothetical protein
MNELEKSLAYKEIASEQYKSYLSSVDEYYKESNGNDLDKLENFSKYVPKGSVSRFIARYELFKKIINIHGSIVECGVFHGGGLMTYAQLSAILEPFNHTRKIIGFDTFGGFTNISQQDEKSTSIFNKEGGYFADSYDDLKKSIEVFDKGRSLGHIGKVELVKGDILETIPNYLEENPHLIVSMLYLDVDVYEPTKVAIKHLLPRMPKGAIIAFDELNMKTFPGETIAVLEELNINKLRIERFAFGTAISYAIID